MTEQRSSESQMPQVPPETERITSNRSIRKQHPCLFAFSGMPAGTSFLPVLLTLELALVIGLILSVTTRTGMIQLRPSQASTVDSLA